MKPHCFTGPTWEKTLRKVRRALGADAVILDSRRVTERSLLGLRRRSRVEITAAAHLTLARAPEVVSERRPAAPATAPVSERIEVVAPPARDPRNSERFRKLHTDLDDLRGLVHAFLAKQTAPMPVLESGALRAARERLTAAHVAPEAVQRIVMLLRANLPAGATAAQGLERLRAYVEAVMQTAGPVPIATRRRQSDRAEGAPPYRVALIGATGVGKTTTLAKLAATVSLAQGRQVGLLTMDTFRIAAVEQLGRYAQILNVPFQAIERADDLGPAMAAAPSVAVWLLDTAGRSPRDDARLKELAPVLDAFAPDETHLVLSAATAAASQIAAWERFAQLKPNRLLLTKLDEAEHFGFVLELAVKTRLPFGYLTTGQNVPDDIEAADPRRLTDLVLGPPAAAAQPDPIVLAEVQDG
jgi:flagellar biosynthesis protein FlhF